MKLCKIDFPVVPLVLLSKVTMGGRVVLLFVVLCAVSASADRKMTVSEKLKEDADLSQVSVVNWSLILNLELTYVPLNFSSLMAFSG